MTGCIDCNVGNGWVDVVYTLFVLMIGIGIGYGISLYKRKTKQQEVEK